MMDNSGLEIDSYSRYLFPDLFLHPILKNARHAPWYFICFWEYIWFSFVYNIACL